MDELFKLAVCQMNVVENRHANINHAVELLAAAADNSAQLVILPEMFNCPYDSSRFREYAETVPGGETARAVSQTSKKLGIYVVAGSIVELENGSIYNTSVIFGADGEIIGKHRKMHLFDVNITGRISFRESSALTAGNDITVVDTACCRIGIAICYDMRFPELFRLMALKGAKLIAVPAAFNMVTGPAHWEMLIRMRAVDNQVYMAAASPARVEESSYVAYGNSMVVDPWGSVVSRAAEKEEIIYAGVDMGYLDKIRKELPLLDHRRTDVYDLSDFGS